MMAVDALPPLLPCADCLADPDRCAIVGEVTSVYCPHNLAGLHHVGALFTAYAPIDADTYGRLVCELDARMQAGRIRLAAN